MGTVILLSLIQDFPTASTSQLARKKLYTAHGIKFKSTGFWTRSNPTSRFVFAIHEVTTLSLPNFGDDAHFVRSDSEILALRLIFVTIADLFLEQSEACNYIRT